jgi:hypothetical protein
MCVTQVTGKFSLRVVQHQSPEQKSRLVLEYLQKVFQLRKSPNRLHAQVTASAKPWFKSPMSLHCGAAMRAGRQVLIRG